MVQGTSDYIFGVIWIIRIQAARCVCVQYSSKSHGWILMKFSGNVLNGTRNKWLDFGSDLDHLDPGCQMFCVQDKSKTYGRILMKFTGYVWKGKRMKWLNFGSDPDHYMDLLDPWNVIFKDRYLKKLWMDCDDIFSKWPKWCEEQVIRFWEWSGSLSGSSGPGCQMFCVQDNSKTYGRILMKFTGYVWKGKRMKWLNFGSDPDHYMDLLDPWNVIFKDRYLKKLWMDCDDIFSKWPKWCEEQVIRFWEWSGSSGSRLPDVFVYNVAEKLMDGFWWNFQDMSEKVTGLNDWILEVIRITILIFWNHEM